MNLGPVGGTDGNPNVHPYLWYIYRESLLVYIPRITIFMDLLYIYRIHYFHKFYRISSLLKK